MPPQNANQSPLVKPNRRFSLYILFFATVILAIFSLGIGYYSLTPLEVVQTLFAPLTGASVPAQNSTVVWQIRLPRIFAALLIGAALSTSGTVYQTMFHNPLVSPDILGVSSGASLGAAISMLMGNSYYVTQLFAFTFGILAVILAYAISCRSKYSPTISLVLIGTVISMLATAGLNLIKNVADPNSVLPAITYWTMGSLAKVDIRSTLLSGVVMLLGFLLIVPLRWRINLLALNEEEAQSLGINLRHLRIIAVVGATLLSAAAVCLGGLISWVGLIIPHIVRRIWGANTRVLVPASIMLGGIFLLLMDNLARALLSVEIPIGILVAFVGAPFFISLLVGRKGRG